MNGRLLKLLILLAGIILVGTRAFAACEHELGQLDRGLPADMPAGSRAAQLFYGAIELVEPALPAWRYHVNVPLAEDQAGYSAVEFLVGRDLLPDDWQAGELATATWQAMLSRFLDWYGLELTEADREELNGADPVSDLSHVLELVGSAVRPVAIIAHEETREVAFLGIIWNWSSYPRLLVKRVEPGTSTDDGPAPLLASLGNCAVQFEHYALAPVATAWRLFVGTGDSTMYVLASDPWRPHLPLAVEQQQVRDYLEFTAPDVAGVSEFSAAFSGQEIGLGSILSMITQIRTNISPVRIGHYLAVPSAP